MVEGSDLDEQALWLPVPERNDDAPFMADGPAAPYDDLADCARPQDDDEADDRLSGDAVERWRLDGHEADGESRADPGAGGFDRRPPRRDACARAATAARSRGR